MTHHFRLNAATRSSELDKIDELFLAAKPAKVARWQSQDIDARPEMQPRELLHCLVEVQLRPSSQALAEVSGANLPWAEDHFQERVGGEPLNPPPSSEWWPYAQAGNAEHKKGELFSHTYPERMWPKYAGEEGPLPENMRAFPGKEGIRFDYGDLGDVVQQLKKDPSTRQAYLPIWFPEDTGAVKGQRVPCTLGYHFLIRDGKLDVTYYIRSCDYIRHFADDVYMAGRLGQWVAAEFNEDAHLDEQVMMGTLYMNIVNFHIFEGDVPKVKARHKANKIAASTRLMEML